MTTQHREMVLHDIWPMSEDWKKDSLRWRGTILTGLFTHWCDEWDGLPIDETSLEFPCGCEGDLAKQLKGNFGVLATLPLQSRKEPNSVASISWPE